MARMGSLGTSIKHPEMAPARRPAPNEPDSPTTQGRRPRKRTHTAKEKETTEHDHEKGNRNSGSGIEREEPGERWKKRQRVDAETPKKPEEAAKSAKATRAQRKRQVASTESVLATTARALESALQSQFHKQRQHPEKVREIRSSNRLRGRPPMVEPDASDSSGEEEEDDRADGKREEKHTRSQKTSRRKRTREEADNIHSVPADIDVAEIEVEIEDSYTVREAETNYEKVDGGDGDDDDEYHGDEDERNRGENAEVVPNQPPLQEIAMMPQDRQTVALSSATTKEIVRLMGSVYWSGKRTWKVTFRQLREDAQSGLLPVTAQGKGLWRLLGDLAAQYRQAPHPVYPGEDYFDPLVQHTFLAQHTATLRHLGSGIRQRLVEICDVSLAPMSNADVTPRERRMRALLCEDLGCFVIPQAAALLETTLLLGGRADDEILSLDGFYVPLDVCRMTRAALEAAAQVASWLARLEAALAHELGYRGEDEDKKELDEEQTGADLARLTKKQTRRLLWLLVNRIQDEICDAKIELEWAVRGKERQQRRAAQWEALEELARRREAEKTAETEVAHMEVPDEDGLFVQQDTPVEDDLLDNLLSNPPIEERNTAVDTPIRSEGKVRLATPGWLGGETPVEAANERGAQVTEAAPEEQAVPEEQVAPEEQPTPDEPQEPDPTDCQQPYTPQEVGRILRHLRKKEEPDLVQLAVALGRNVFDVAHQVEVLKNAARTLAVKQREAIPAWARAGYLLPGYGG